MQLRTEISVQMGFFFKELGYFTFFFLIVVGGYFITQQFTRAKVLSFKLKTIDLII